MAMNMGTDNLNMLSGSEFGATSLTVNGVAISGIFDAAYFEIVAANGGVESTQPGVLCRTSDVPGVAHGAPVVVDGVNYTVVGNKPDGTGMTEFALERV